MDESTEFKNHWSEVFSRASPTYDRVGPSIFTYFGDKLVDFADLKAGSSVLDVACGRGAVLFPASKAVTNNGQVIGIDISREMIKRTRQDIVERKIDNAQVFEMDAEKLDLPDAQFDYALCGLCLFFFPNLDQALKEFYRVLKPGGYIVASTFKSEKDDELSIEWKKLYGSFKDRIYDIPQVDTLSLDTRSEIKNEFAAARFLNPKFAWRRKTLYYRDEDDWWQTAWSHGQRSYLERIPDDLLPEFKSRALEIVRKKERKRGIPLRWDLIFSKAQKP